MRAVSFVDRLDFEFQGNLLLNAITLGDVDNDNNNELSVGNVSGEIVIFKGADTKPWKTADGNGIIAALVVGDIFNENRNVLVSVSGEGWCSIFDVESEIDEYRTKILPVHLQRLMANTKVALLCDVDGDGSIELVIGMSDRVVRSYRWIKLTQQVTNTKLNGRLVAQNKWEFASQIGDVALNTNHDGTSSLMIAQPGGTYVHLKCYNNTDAKDAPGINQLQYHSLSISKMRNKSVSTVIVGNIKRNDGKQNQPTLYALATLDGTIMLLDKEKVIWSLQVNHQLFTMTKLDITGDGFEEVVACSWDGVTYFINHDQQALRFQFDDSINTFTAGKYSIFPGDNIPCLVYVTFTNHIYLYYNIEIEQIPTSNLLRTLSSEPSISSMLTELHIDGVDHKSLQKLYSWLLYGSGKKASESF